ncbi:MAG: peptidoglycan DD-metalloendopeptidase family protein [Winogradskyella sp.]|uniref:peptidoglycan DD-metalloendopeptidase family protein n=1 Tax=Winogradskyella sp. TaxID=1883156 RepID=UPI0025F3D644|nr:peptidoglycan DD-metalloendopeptidase family protein [Winogradskyella sp.]NRB58763.1 peptidoglycan DD-metalloendopeptidase family protein [Winogradskyella sp.]
MPETEFQLLLKSLDAHKLVDPSISYDSYVALDLSVQNETLKHIDVSSSQDLEKYIWTYMSKHNAKVAYGGYIEHRGIYNRSDYFNQADPEEERNIHLGLDLWIEADEPIYAPLPGVIHSFKNNTNYGDYGPTIIIEHLIDGFRFNTLYGHLSLNSIENIQTGIEVKQGQQIGTLGTASVNGDYPPHLHFQIIKNLQDNYGDYPGVSNQKDLAFYKANCPDPNLLLQIY